MLNAPHSRLQMLQPPQTWLKQLQEEHRAMAQLQRKEPAGDLLLWKQDSNSNYPFLLAFGSLTSLTLQQSLCTSMAETNIIQRNTRRICDLLWLPFCRTEGSTSTLTLTYPLKTDLVSCRDTRMRPPSWCVYHINSWCILIWHVVLSTGFR